jgi:hypothetical protein
VNAGTILYLTHDDEYRNPFGLYRVLQDFNLETEWASIRVCEKCGVDKMNYAQHREKREYVFPGKYNVYPKVPKVTPPVCDGGDYYEDLFRTLIGNLKRRGILEDVEYSHIHVEEYHNYRLLDCG